MLSLYQLGQYGSARCSRTFKEAVFWISQFSFSFCPFQSMEVSQLWQELNSDVSVVLFISCQFVACQWKLLQQTSLPVNILASSREKRKGVKMLFFFKNVNISSTYRIFALSRNTCGSVRLNFTAYTDPISDMYLSSLGWRIALDEKLVELSRDESHKRVRYTYIQTHTDVWPVSSGDSDTERCWNFEWRPGWHDASWKRRGAAGWDARRFVNSAPACQFLEFLMVNQLWRFD